MEEHPSSNCQSSSADQNALPPAKRLKKQQDFGCFSRNSKVGEEQCRGSTKEPTKEDGTELEVIPLPLDVWEEIFLNLPPYCVVFKCRLVCRQWKDVVDTGSFWSKKCRREGYHLRDASKVPSSWRLFYFMCKNRRNLIKNPRAEEGLNNWIVTKNGGDGWITERIFIEHPDKKVQKNFVTSFWMCEKYQTIDLEREGYNSFVMDNVQPDIRICDWYTSRFDCCAQYSIRVELLNERMELVQVFAPETIPVPADYHRKWRPMTHTFKNYGPGVRCIRFTHGGKDKKFWKGWFGVRLTGSCVEIYPQNLM